MALMVVVVFLTPWPHILRSFYFCLSPVDFSIYQQAFIELAEGKWNPYVTIRESPIFSDHVDPIIYWAALWHKLLGPSPLISIAIEWSWLVLSFLLVFWFGKKNEFSRPQLVVALMLLVFSRGVHLGMEYAIHPTTWAIFPVLLLMYFLAQKSSWGIFFSALFLAAFKEVFCLTMVPLSFYFIGRKKWKLGFALLITQGSIAYFLLALRPMFIPTIDYSFTFTSELRAGNWGVIFERLANVKDMDFKTIIPYLPLLVLRWTSLPLLILTSSYIGIHLLGGRFYQQHYAPLAAFFIGAIVFSPSFKGLFHRPKVLGVCLVLLLATCSSKIKKILRMVVLKNEPMCVVDQEMRDKDRAFSRFAKSLPHLSGQDLIYATPGIVPRLLRPGLNIRIPRALYHYPIYDYLLLERNPGAFRGEEGVKYVADLLQRCAPHVEKILYEDHYFVALKGHFDELNCVKQGALFAPEIFDYENLYLPKFQGKLYQVHRF